MAQLLKNLPAVWDAIPRLGRSPGEGSSYPLQYTGLENSMDCIVHRVTKSRIRVSDFLFPQRLTGLISLQSKGFSRIFSRTTV